MEDDLNIQYSGHPEQTSPLAPLLHRPIASHVEMSTCSRGGVVNGAEPEGGRIWPGLGTPPCIGEQDWKARAGLKEQSELLLERWNWAERGVV